MTQKNGIKFDENSLVTEINNIFNRSKNICEKNIFVLIGKNGSGKTSILKDFFFKPKILKILKKNNISDSHLILEEDGEKEDLKQSRSDQTYYKKWQKLSNKQS